ncbi:MAG: carboxymuconolactone decarboxylase family protein [Gammaproteobacteria bacterium]|nr:carboxymuconolactone decarboxylase family protein [Gammaproteobacteria bacterium]MDD9958568.1 carboxymuconolactone decarboxylase family protein [Gammaproteobacteria bacterium]
MNTKIALFTALLLFIAVSTHFTITANAQEVEYQLQGMQTQDKIPADIHMDSLARLPQVQRAELDEVGQNAFDTYVRPGTGYETGLRGPVGMWMHSPILAEAVFDLRQRVRYGTPKDQRLTELIILSTAREISNQYEWSAHEPLAQAAGLEQDIIEVVKYRKDMNSLPPINGFGEIEQTLVQFTRELVSEEKVSAATFAKAIDLFGGEGLVDIVGLVGYYNFVAMTLKAFDVQRPVGTELLLPMVSD